MGGVVKAVGKAVKEVAKATVDITIGIPGKLVADGIGMVGNIVEKVPGLESLGKEIERWGEDTNQVIKVLSGDYKDDVRKVEEYKRMLDKRGDYLEYRIKQYNVSLDELIDRLERLIAFDEIFKMAMSNRIDNFQESEGPELEILTQEYQLMMRELQRMVAQLKSEYDFVIGLTEGAFLQRIIGSIIMIVGGLISDIQSVTSGEASSAEWKSLITATVAVVAVVITWGYALTATTPFLLTSAVLATIAAFMTLDGMYANGAATGAIMSTLDFLFNDVLNLDDLIGSDFKHFDKDNADYQQMVGYTKLAISLASIATAWGSTLVGETTSASGASATGVSEVKTVDSYLDGTINIGDSLETSSFLGVKFTTYGQVFKVYSYAQEIKDVVTANSAYKTLKEQLNSDIQKLNEAVYAKTDKSMMKHYKDTAYFLQDQQEYIDRYIWSMVSQNMYVDPYGTTPVANIRFMPDNDTRMLNFGYEDVFDEGNQAGSKNYFNSIIYGG